MVSLTNGDAGHHEHARPRAGRRRRAEAAAAGAVIGATYEVLDNHDGELLPTLENRRQVIRLIRTFHPDLVLTHRPNDYHPDHRYTSQLVQDAAYMVTVPAVVPDVPHLPSNPVIAYLPDDFQKPYPLSARRWSWTSARCSTGSWPCCTATVAVLRMAALQLRTSRPGSRRRRRAATPGWPSTRRSRLRPRADRYRELLVETYGPEHGRRVEYVEAFEPCEYGAPLDDAARRRLFPFIPWKK